MLQQKYERLNAAWAKAETIFKEINYPYDVWIRLPNDDLLGWARCKGSFRLCWRKSVESQIIPITDSPLIIRLKASIGLPKLKEFIDKRLTDTMQEIDREIEYLEQRIKELS